MLKAWIFISTLAFLMTSSSLPTFNTSPVLSKKASIKNNSAPEISFGEAAVLSPASGALCTFFPKEAGKVIKSRQFKEATFKLNTVVIDPGHGGYDSGCLGAHSQEKHLALNISKMLAAQIQKAFPDVRVILTRSTDKFVPLHERATIANTNKADLFISIHCNAMTNASWIKGSETYVLGLHRTKENLEVAKRENAVVLLEEDYEKNYDFDPNSDEGHILLSMVQNAFLEQSIQFASKVENHMENHANRHSRG
ncbi:MAG: N-acetylmuramoyl-L-alanine amidase, partial [Bacteroidetes bacterium]